MASRRPPIPQSLKIFSALYSKYVALALLVSLKITVAEQSVQASLEKELEQHCRDQRAALASRLRKRKAAKEESLRRAGAGEEETTAAMQALEFEAERYEVSLRPSSREEYAIKARNEDVVGSKTRFNIMALKCFTSTTRTRFGIPKEKTTFFVSHLPPALSPARLPAPLANRLGRPFS